MRKEKNGTVWRCQQPAKPFFILFSFRDEENTKVYRPSIYVRVFTKVTLFLHGVLAIMKVSLVRWNFTCLRGKFRRSSSFGTSQIPPLTTIPYERGKKRSWTWKAIKYRSGEVFRVVRRNQRYYVVVARKRIKRWLYCLLWKNYRILAKRSNFPRDV